ncbi:MAG: hypothetical protein LC785_06395 [Acidobacteria bacterium]|nr:hypothetical protein [Acidobacteriota bacterium]MCA1641573.1 hypothetical protein [Acidobacteriota bacterium]
MKPTPTRNIRRRPAGATLKRFLVSALLVVPLSIKVSTSLNLARGVRSGDAPQETEARAPVNVASLDIPAFIREVAASERANNRNFADYTYTAKTTDRETKDGKVVKEKVTVAEIYPQYGEAVHKVISRDGVALSAEESEREFRRAVEGFKKGEQEAAKRRAEAAKQAEGAKQSNAPTPAPDPKAIPSFGPNWGFGFRSGFSSGSFTLSLYNFLRAGEFSAPRLERFRGRDAVVLDFRPRADYAPASDAVKPYAKLAGRIWIDVADRQIMRVEARPVPEALKKGDAPAASNAEPWIVIEQTRLPDGRWKESHIRLNTTADKSVFNGVERDHTEEMTDFRKFSADAEGKVDATKPPDKP